MPKPKLSWLIAVLIFISIYIFFYLHRSRRNHRIILRRLFRRRRRRSPAFELHLFDFQPTHSTGAGLDPSAIAALPTDQFAALKLLTNGRVSSDCAVCLDPFEDAETLRFIPKCQHAFHPACLDPWLRSRATCPSCRASIESTRPPEPEPAESTRSCSYDVVIDVSESGEQQEQEDSNNNLPMLGSCPKLVWAQFWKQKAPLRLKILVCQALSGALPLARRRRCALCAAAVETPEHLFFRCQVARALWYDFWGVRTDGPVTGEWTAANWVEASLFPNRLLACHLEEEGQVFLFLGCLIDKVWALRNRVVDGLEDDVSVQRLNLAVAGSFWELRSAFCVH